MILFVFLSRYFPFSTLHSLSLAFEDSKLFNLNIIDLGMKNLS